MRYYGLKLKESLIKGRLQSAIHACRVLVAGSWYHLTGSQPRGRLTGRKTFQTMWLLRHELARHGLIVRGALPDSVPAAPTLLLERIASSLEAGTASRL